MYMSECVYIYMYLYIYSVNDKHKTIVVIEKILRDKKRVKTIEKVIQHGSYSLSVTFNF